MNQLQIIKKNDELYIDSREVAEMVEKEHKILLRDIRKYIEYMGTKVNPSQFFVESTYQDKYSRNQSMYLLTKKGCDMVANKMTGEKGILFTAMYVDAFHQMEEAIKENRIILPSDPMEVLELVFKANKKTDEKVNRIEAEVIDIKENQKLDAGEYNLVGKRVTQKVNETIKNYGLTNNRKVKKELYKELNSSINRITNIRTRTQLKQKHFEDVMDFINTWTPSNATLYLVRQMDMTEVDGEVYGIH